MRRSPEDRRNHLDEDTTATETKLQGTEHHEEPQSSAPAELHPPSSLLPSIHSGSHSQPSEHAQVVSHAQTGAEPPSSILSPPSFTGLSGRSSPSGGISSPHRPYWLQNDPSSHPAVKQRFPAHSHFGITIGWVTHITIATIAVVFAVHSTHVESAKVFTSKALATVGSAVTEITAVTA